MMQIIPFTWGETDLKIEYLHEAGLEPGTKMHFGVVTFPANSRFPEEGYSAHDGIEISIILEGSFDLLGPDSNVEINPDCMLILPKGHAHAVQTKAPVKLMFALVKPDSGKGSQG